MLLYFVIGWLVVGMSEEGGSIWKLLSVVLIVSLICSCFVVYYSLDDKGLAVASESSFIDVAVVGPEKLGVNETGIYEAILNVSDNPVFSWSVFPVDDNVVIVPDGASCSLTFIVATSDSYMLCVDVSSVDGVGYGFLRVYDPYTSSSLYLSSTGAAYDWLCESDGLGWYRAINGLTGQAMYESTNASYTYNMAAAALTHTRQETIIIQGPDWTITNPLLVYSFETLRVETTISLANSANCDMLLTANPSSFYSFILDGGSWDGNAASQTSGHIFNLRQYAEFTGSEPSVIRNVHAKEGYNDIVHLYNNASYSMIWDIHDNVFGQCGNAGVYMNGIVDSLVHDNLIQGDSYNLYMIGGNNIISNNYYAGAGVCNIYLYGNTFQFNGGFIDTNGFPGIICDGVERSQFSDLTIRSIGSTGDGSYDGIVLRQSTVDGSTNCVKNNFVNIVFYQTGGCRFKYGIEETDSSQKGNIFSAVNAPTGASQATSLGAIRKLGSTSVNGTNIGTVITS